MAKNNNLTDFLTGVADAIRTKKGTTNLINPQDFESEILSIETGGEQTKQYKVRVYDYDGTILLETSGNDGDVINLPEVPTHEKLAFQEWVCSQSLNEDGNSVTINGNDVAVGAVYSSASGNHEFDIRLTKKTGLEVTLSLNGVKDWGDGSSDEGNTHTYSGYGDYTISVSGSVEFSDYVMNQTFSTPNYTLMNVRLGIDYNISSDYVFRYCRALSTITIPRSYNTSNAGYDFSFQSCHSLRHVTIEPGGIIMDSKFGDCYSISSVVILNGVTSISGSAFSGCSKLTSITIPNSIRSISGSAFSGCSKLTTINIPNAVTSIGRDAFQGCTALKNIITQDSLTSIGEQAFRGCYGLTSVTIPGSLTNIGQYTFNNCYGLTSVTIPGSVTRIENWAFNSCKKLTSITIPGSVTSIGSDAFSNCSGLTSVSIGNGVTSINGSAFESCRGLTSVTIPDSVTSINGSAFAYCYSCLKYNFSNNTQVPALSNVNAFNYINQAAKIIVPDSLYDTWITSTNWVDLADYIYKVSEVQEV